MNPHAYYELWDTEDSNLIGSFISEHAALDIVRRGVARYGQEAFATVALGRGARDGVVLVAKGDDLVRMALSRRRQRRVVRNGIIRVRRVVHPATAPGPATAEDGRRVA